MTISKLATEQWPLAKTAQGQNRFYKRPSNPKGFIVHHAATLTDNGLKSQYVSRNRVLSSNYAMRKDGTIVAVLHEEYRPFTSSSSKADNWGITIEIVNESGAPNWKISDQAFDNLARLIADCAVRWGWTISRNTVIGHREVLPRFGQGVATVCPGPWLWARMDELVERARQYAKQGSPAPAPSKPAPAPAPTPSVGDVKLGSYLKLSNWTAYSTPSLTGKQGANLNGTFKVTGISGGNFHLEGNGRDAWVANSAKAGLVPAPTQAPAPKPAPAPAPKQVVLGSVLKLAHWVGYTTRFRVKRKGVLNGNYVVRGISNLTGSYLVYGPGGEFWVHNSAKKGLQ